ncbi:MAG: D-alanyl-D-alanine carboxypeptidase family protein [Xanthomonadales bacterium]|nr:D-alanyl-D-alanine carboxypeptidase family protein [Xanthomonadales bacterium]
MKPIASLLLLAVALGPLAAVAQTPTPTPNPPRAMPMPAAPQLGATSYILQDFDSGQVLVESNADQRVEPASITKMMTTYVAFKELASGNLTLDETVPISERAWRTEGSRMFVDPSMQVSVRDLLMGVIVQSGNDASVALAEHLAGSEEAFAGVMNHYAEQLGMDNTHFTNATGLPDPELYTTARDIATLSIATIREFPDYYAWYSEKEFTFNDIRQHNRNTLLWRDPAVDGLKTGHTESAGYCLAASAKRDGQRLVSVVMGASSENARAADTQTLMNYGFRFFATVKIYEAGQELARARVWKGLDEEIAVGLAEPLLVTIPRGRYEDLEATMDIRPSLTAPLAQGDVVGQVHIALDDDMVTERDLVALGALEEAGFLGRSWDGFKLWMGGLFGDDEEEADVADDESESDEAE